MFDRRGYRVCFLAIVALAMNCARSPMANGQEPSPLATATAMEKVLTEAIERAEKSVVAIARVRREEGRRIGADDIAAPAIPGLSGGDPTDPDFIPNEFGTGVVIDAKGLIVTNLHVIGDHRANDYFVWISRKPYAAKLKAADPWLDLAVLQVAADGLKPIALGDARALKKGQFVIALGNPYAIARDGQPSASWGIVANLHRQAPAPRGASRPSGERETLHHWGTLIQTDARLELGTSGGALVNLSGEMIGLTTSLAALYGYERPGGFAVPVDADFRRALDVLKTGRLPDYGFLGVAPRYLTMAERQQGKQGARVQDVVPATPAAVAGLRTGDVITHIAGEPIADDLELIRRLSGLFADANVTLRVLRGGSETRIGRPRNVEIKLSKKRLENNQASYTEIAPAAWRGLQVEYATAAPTFREHSRELDPAGSVGVVEVERDSAAWNAGMRPGDFISHVGQTRVATPREFHAAAESLAGDVELKLTAAQAASIRRVVAAP
jgi:serine protease Do